jgi:hypothetical protein
LPAPQQQAPQQQAAAPAYISARLAAAEVARDEPTAQVKVKEGGQNISPIFLENTMQKKQCYAYDSSTLVDLR